MGPGQPCDVGRRVVGRGIGGKGGQSLYVIRAFINMREDLAANGAILKRLAEIDKTLQIHDVALREVFEKLRPLLAPPPPSPKPEIGIHVKKDANPYRIRKRTDQP
jgi:hypothetical protein